MHHLQLAEAFPLAPGGAGILTGLATLFTVILWAIAIGLLIVWRRTVGALFEHLADLLDRASIHTGLGTIRPFGFVSGALREADWAVQQGLDDAVHGTERAIVYLWGATTWFFRLTGHMIRGLAHDVEVAFHWIEHHRIPRAIALALIPPLAAIVAIRHLVHANHARTTNSVTRLRDDVHSIGHSTSVVLPRSIGNVRTREGRLEHDLEAIKARVDHYAKLVTLAGFSAFMWRWLGRHGLRWLRCPSLARIGSRIGCGGFGLLEDLLALSFTALALSDICAFAGSLTRLAEWYRPLLMDFVDEEDRMLKCKGGYTKPAPLGLPRLYLPPVPDPLPLG